MNPVEKCYFCGTSDRDGGLVPWFVAVERRSIHMPCWVAAYRSGDPEATESTPDETEA